MCNKHLQAKLITKMQSCDSYYATIFAYIMQEFLPLGRFFGKCSTWNGEGILTAYRPNFISITFMSAGLTPGIRDACPIVVGRIFVSF